MGLLAPGDQQKLRDAFAGMTAPVRLLLFTQTFGCETCDQAKQILSELPPLSEKITLDEINVVLDKDKAATYSVDRAPAIAIVSIDAAGVEHDTRMRFLGAPSGYEFVSLVHAVLLAGGGESQLTPESRARVAAVDRPVTMQVFSTPT
jgi:alkyl hydroperoxide reductase subunit AhpF